MKRKKSGFTIVELLTAVAIVAMLVAVLVPALNMVRRIAKETQQKAQLTTIDMALMAFKSDYGEYPPSRWAPPPNPSIDYCGAQKFAEALLGWDLLGFHPDSAWRSDGLDEAGGPWTYDPDKERDNDADGVLDTLHERKGPYLELASANAFKLGDLFGWGIGDTDVLDPNTFVVCDVFSAKKVTVGEKTVKAGSPILYYRADTSEKYLHSFEWNKGIYKIYDNLPLIGLGKMADRRPHPLANPPQTLHNYDYEGGIKDPKVTATDWPYRPDSYILISAGADGEYGTSDDIRNF